MKLLNELVTGYSFALDVWGRITWAPLIFLRVDATVGWHVLPLSHEGTDDDGKRPACIPLFPHVLCILSCVSPALVLQRLMLLRRRGEAECDLCARMAGQACLLATRLPSLTSASSHPWSGPSWPTQSRRGRHGGGGDGHRPRPEEVTADEEKMSWKG